MAARFSIILLSRWPATRAHRSLESLGSKPTCASARGTPRPALPRNSASCRPASRSLTPRAARPHSTWSSVSWARSRSWRDSCRALGSGSTRAEGFGCAGPRKHRASRTDVSENEVRNLGLASALVDNKICAIDEVWSGLRLVVRVRDRPRW